MFDENYSLFVEVPVTAVAVFTMRSVFLQANVTRKYTKNEQRQLFNRGAPEEGYLVNSRHYMAYIYILKYTTRKG